VKVAGYKLQVARSEMKVQSMESFKLQVASYQEKGGNYQLRIWKKSLVSLPSGIQGGLPEMQKGYIPLG
jgi:hypothetical protein